MLYTTKRNTLEKERGGGERGERERWGEREVGGREWGGGDREVGRER